MYCEMDFWSKLRVKYSSFHSVVTYPLLLSLSCLYDILYVLTLSTFRIEDQPVQKRNQESEKLPLLMSTIKVCQVIYYHSYILFSYLLMYVLYAFKLCVGGQIPHYLHLGLYFVQYL